MSTNTDSCYQTNLLDIYRGNDVAFLGCIRNPATKEGIDISGWSFRILLKHHYRQSDSNAVVNMTIGPLYDLSAKQGDYYVWFKNEVTEELTSPRYYMDIVLEHNGLKQTILRGKIKLIGDTCQIVTFQGV